MAHDPAEYPLQKHLISENSSELDLPLRAYSGVMLKLCEGEMRVPDQALKAVVYIGNATDAGTFRAVGTGFLVNVTRDNGLEIRYLVTADHVRRGLVNDKTFAIRLNDRAGNAQIMRSPSAPRWWKHPSDKSVDAAIYPWSLSSPDFRVATFPTGRFVTAKHLEMTKSGLGIGPGDETFIVGLFRKRAGNARVTPIVRHGHIAMMATEPMPTKNYGEAYLHLIEAFSLAGLSGSPVFVHETVYLPILRQSEEDEPASAMAVGKIYCLGLVHGILPTEVMVEIAGTDPKQKWHSGISMVVPSTKIIEILDQPRLIAYEQTLEKQIAGLEKRKRKKGEEPD
jgi:hypothetical protein